MASSKHCFALEEVLEFVTQNGSGDEEGLSSSGSEVDETEEREVGIERMLESDIKEENEVADDEAEMDTGAPGQLATLAESAGSVFESGSDLDIKGSIGDNRPGNEDIDPAFNAETNVDELAEPEEWGQDLSNWPQVPPFRPSATGLQVDLGDDPRPIDIYRLFIDDTILKHIKKETNRYAESCIAERRLKGPLPPRSMFVIWKKVTTAELQNFFAICMHMGVVNKPHVTDYWSANTFIHSSFAALVMRRDRFKAILAFLHVNDNATYIPYGADGHDPIHKIRPFVSHLQDKFQEVYMPGREICVDEAMCPFKGRSRFKVYMKDKPIKCGFKFYELCESTTGYVFRFEMFCRQQDVSNKPYDVVMRLMAPLLMKGYHLFIDNYYCEPNICADLARLGTMVCGTVRSNRLQMPRDLTAQPLQRGQIDYRRRGNVVACRWRDGKNVYTLSTMDGPELQRVRCRTGERDKPRAVVNYIKHMAGVDRGDQLLSYFPMHRKNLKWWKKPFFHLLTLCTLQTLVILNKHRKSRGLKRMALEAMIMSLGEDLLTVDVEASRSSAAEGPCPPVCRLTGRHFPQTIPQVGDRRPRRNCVVCYAKKIAAGGCGRQRSNTTRTNAWCPVCQKVMCPMPCFEIYHTKKTYIP